MERLDLRKCLQKVQGVCNNSTNKQPKAHGHDVHVNPVTLGNTLVAKIRILLLVKAVGIFVKPGVPIHSEHSTRSAEAGSGKLGGAPSRRFKLVGELCRISQRPDVRNLRARLCILVARSLWHRQRSRCFVLRCLRSIEGVLGGPRPHKSGVGSVD